MSQLRNLTKGGPVILPPAGEYATFVDTDGTAKIVDSSGTVSALGGGSSSAWATARQKVLDGLVSGLTYQYIKPSNRTYPLDSATTPVIATDPGILGGGISPVGGHYSALTGAIYTDLTTQHSAWAARGKFAVPGANFQSMGPVDATGVNFANLVAGTSYDATHLCLILTTDGGSVAMTKIVTTHVIDGLVHNYGITFDGTTYKALVDDVVVGSTADLSHLAAANVAWAAFNGTNGNVTVSELLYGY